MEKYWKNGCKRCKEILSGAEKRDGVKVHCKACDTKWICFNNIFIVDSNSASFNGKFNYPCPT